MDTMRICARINLDNIAYNVECIQKKLPKDVEIMAVIKADGYGHGAVQVAKTLKKQGINSFAVATVDEAVELREQCIDGRILILGYVFPQDLSEVIEYDITSTVFSYEAAQQLSRIAMTENRTAKIHIKLDTGMGRIGFLPDENSFLEIEKISKLPNIKIEGLFTHFARADEKDKTSMNHQIEIFDEFAKRLKKSGVNIPILHYCNSAAVMEKKDGFLNMVRAGIMIYGLYPSNEVSRDEFKLKPAMSLESHISNVKEVGPGFTVSYGSTFVTDRNSIIATVPVGYADGYSRLLSNKGRVIVNGEYAPIIGRICMDQFMIDVTDIPNVRRSDTVTLFGRQGDKEISVDEIAEIAGTINYEIVCDINKRVPRIYQ